MFKDHQAKNNNGNVGYFKNESVFCIFFKAASLKIVYYFGIKFSELYETMLFLFAQIKHDQSSIDFFLI